MIWKTAGLLIQDLPVYPNPKKKFPFPFKFSAAVSGL
jgi:hypothetical protein